MSFSFTETSFKRNITIHFLTATYNICNVALYLESPNEFPEHYGILENGVPITHRLSEFSKDNGLQIAAFTAIVLFDLALFYSNQVSYSKHIDGVLPQAEIQDYDEESQLTQPPKKKDPSRFDLGMSITSGLFKATVGSLSLAAFLKNDPVKAGPAWAWSISGFCFLGNFFAQFSIFAKELVQKYNINLSHNKRWALAHFLTICYNIPNAALYFNTGDEFLRHIKLIDHRLITGEDWWDYGLVGFLGLSSIFLLISTQRSYSKKIADIFKSHDEETDAEVPRIEYSCTDIFYNAMAGFFKFESRWSTGYKAAINYLALVSTIFSFTEKAINNHAGTVTLSFALSSLCILGNLYAQYSILVPELSEKQKFENTLEPKVSRPRFFGLFSETVVREPIGLSLQTSSTFYV